MRYWSETPIPISSPPEKTTCMARVNFPNLALVRDMVNGRACGDVSQLLAILLAPQSEGSS